MFNLINFLHTTFWKNKAKQFSLLVILVCVLLLSGMVNSCFSYSTSEPINLKNSILSEIVFRHEWDMFYILDTLTAEVIPIFELLYIGAFLFCHFYRQNQVTLCINSAYKRTEIFLSLYLYACLLASTLICLYALIFAAAYTPVFGAFASPAYYKILLIACIECCCLNWLYIALLLLFVIILKGNYLSLLFASSIYFLGIFLPLDTYRSNFYPFSLKSKLPFIFLYLPREIIHPFSDEIHNIVRTELFWTLNDYLLILVYLVVILALAYHIFKKQDI